MFPVFSQSSDKSSSEFQTVAGDSNWKHFDQDIDTYSPLYSVWVKGHQQLHLRSRLSLLGNIFFITQKQEGALRLTQLSAVGAEKW